MNETIREYDKNNNLIRSKYFDGYEIWSEYDENNNKIHYKDNDDFEEWYKYDNENNEKIKITKKEYKEIKFRKEEKEYLSREKVSRFEIMDI